MENMLDGHALGSRGKFRIVSGWLDLNLVDAQTGEKNYPTPLKNSAFELEVSSLKCPWYFGFKFAVWPYTI